MARNRTRQEKQHQEKIRRIFLWSVGLPLSGYLAFSLVFGDLGLQRYFALKKESKTIQTEIRSLEHANARLRRDMDSLKTDPQMIERLARERLGLVREGDVVYQFPKN